MKSAETLLACCVVGLACFIGGQTVGTRRAALKLEADGTIVRPGSAAASNGRTSSGAASDAAAGTAELTTNAAQVLSHGEEVLVAAPPSPAGARRTAAAAGTVRSNAATDDVRRRLALGMAGTYLDELLLARDSAISRWPDRTTRPLRIHIGAEEALESWNPEFVPAVREAFEAWVAARLPVRFSFVMDSITADVHVRFVDHFANGISGKTVWSRDGAYWLLSGHIQLAVTHPKGGTVTAPQMRAIALHEVGHLLGLDHSRNEDNIMAARVRVRELSEADKATARLMYAVPAGSLKY